MRVFVTDCEGPISKNDNAFELCCHFIPEGEKFFSLLSRYDDYLAYVEKREGYKAGDTLRLIVPFLIAFGATDEAIERFSAENILIMPRAKESLNYIFSLMPAFIVSTSYEPYIRALSEVLSFPFDYTYCTRLRLEGFYLPEAERKRLRELSKEMVSLPMIDWPEGAQGKEDLGPHSRKAVERLDEIFWRELLFSESAQVLMGVDPVGGEAKAEAIKDVARRVGSSLGEVIYVGDSITDEKALRLVREGGGVAVSFNGNSYALREAEIATLAPDARALAALAHLFYRGGKEGVLEGVRRWDKGYLLEMGLPEELIPEGAEVVRLNEENLQEWIERSEAFRRQVRGEKVGRLG